MMRFGRKIIFILLAVFIAYSSESCSKFQQSKRQEAQRRKKFEKEKEERQKEAEEAYEEAIQRHYAIQDKKTKRLMKENARKSQDFKEHKKPGFFAKLFTPKQKKGKGTKGKGGEK